MTDPDEEATIALALGQSKRLADILVLLLETAARTHPDLLREAIGKVFDLSAWQKQADRIAADVRETHKRATETQHILADVERRLGRIRTSGGER